MPREQAEPAEDALQLAEGASPAPRAWLAPVPEAQPAGALRTAPLWDGNLPEEVRNSIVVP